MLVDVSRCGWMWVEMCLWIYVNVVGCKVIWEDVGGHG